MRTKNEDPLAFYRDQLADLEAEGRLRQCRVVEPSITETIPEDTPEGAGVRVWVDGRAAINFSSNDYLGLSRDFRLKEAAIETIARYGIGSGASRLVSGTQAPVERLERLLANFKRTEAALSFSSGYQANVSMLQALLSPGDAVFCDRLNHASLLDGCLLSGARLKRYRHLDLNHLEDGLKKASGHGRRWIVTDSVFSMDGDYPDLARLADLAGRYDALTLVDEAHATGLYGDERRSGLCEHFGVSDRITVQMGTFSKALGAAGAYAAGSRTMMDMLINRARGFIYSTAPPSAIIAAAARAIEVVGADPEPRRRLWNNIALFRQTAERLGLAERVRPRPPTGLPDSPIMPVLIGDQRDAMRISQALLEAGYFVQAIRPPTVPVGTSRLRIALSAAHTPEQTAGLVHTLAATLI